ncbi:SRPBCC family protein [Streptomyces tsukubensis]|uniref:GntR family transcriptional regulator n=1 Tax=Streptomyces tsukubensis TaxID=83656 RepID=A0A1V4A119_9ACTN|nr:SRPBCC family protein [Streptomyces tsukubensis]OON72530.1 GntR family transcriptional regulator [Streptomyces tsukubensis]QFR93655.1 GntR family transcriptional regulator [Streptomyces tsukubensis]
MADTPPYVHVSYIEGAPEKVWGALTDPDLTARYWGHSNVSDWRPGSTWEHRRTDGSGVADVVGTVVENSAPHRLVITWAEPGSDPGPSRVTFTVEPYERIVRLTVIHEGLPPEAAEGAADGWPAVLSNLKTFLETGAPLSSEPWSMP